MCINTNLMSFEKWYTYVITSQSRYRTFPPLRVSLFPQIIPISQWSPLSMVNRALCSSGHPLSTNFSGDLLTSLPASHSGRMISQRLIRSGRHSIYKTHFLDFPFLSGWRCRFFQGQWPSMAWFRGQSVLTNTIFYFVFFLPFHTTGCHLVPTLCPASTHLEDVPWCSSVLRTLLLQLHLHGSNGTDPPDLNQVIPSSGQYLIATDCPDQLISPS